MRLRRLLSLVILCSSAALAFGQDAPLPDPLPETPADAQLVERPAHSEDAQAALESVRARTADSRTMGETFARRRDDLQATLEEIETDHEKLRAAYAEEGDGPAPLDDAAVRERVASLREQLRADEGLDAADRRDRERVTAELARARRRAERLDNQFARWERTAKESVPPEEWDAQETLWKTLKANFHAALDEQLRVRAEIAGLADRCRSLRAQISARRRATLSLLARENLLLRSPSAITAAAIQDGIDDLELVPQWVETAAIDAWRYVINPAHTSDVVLFTFVSLAAVFLLLYLRRRVTARRRPEGELTKHGERVAQLARELIATLLLAVALASVPVLLGTLLADLNPRASRAWIGAGTVVGIAWFVRGSMLRLLPKNERWTPLRVQPRSLVMMRAGVRLLVYGTLAFVPFAVVLQELDYPNRGALQAWWAIYKVFAVLVLVVFILQKDLVRSVLPEKDTFVVRIARWLAAFVRPTLIVVAPLLLAMDLLGFDVFVLVATRLLMGIVAGCGAAIALNSLVWTAVAAWLRSAMNPEDAPAGQPRITARRELDAALQIGAYLARVATIVAGVFVLLAIVGGDFSSLRAFFDDELPFQGAVEGRKVTWWGLILGSSLLVLFLTAVSKVKLTLEHFVLPRTSFEPSVRYTICTLVGYVVAAIGLYGGLIQIFDLSALGFIFAALSVGIGFGLQEIVANFISGLILLFERPIKVGDLITVGTTEGVVEKINIRATRIQTLDNVSMLIPNKDFITQAVVNSVYNDTIVRLRIPVGVAYGSDLELVRRILVEVGTAHPERLPDRPAEAMFIGFGASSLDFELRVWLRSADRRPAVGSELRFEIDAAFRKHDIEIPFSQHDLHVRSVDDATARKLFGDARGARTENATGSAESDPAQSPEDPDLADPRHDE